MGRRRRKPTNHRWPAWPLAARRAWLIAAVTTAGLITVVVVAVILQPRQSPGPFARSDNGVLSSSDQKPRPEANARRPPRGEYVGVETCAECHAAQYESYRQTAHSDAFSKVDPAAEPPSGRFVHKLSGREYEVFRRDDAIYHQESLPVDTSPVQSQHQLKYLVGSGRHSRTYLVDVNGFLLESPITWYASRKAWDISPGYDRPDHLGFERPAEWGCLVCHMGRAEPIDDAYHRLKIVEMPIGCERCHGPGGDHVRLRRSLADAKTVPEKLPQDNIVNPGRLSRELNEAICAQCHLRGESTVPRTGKRIDDFLPGRPLTEARIDYRLQFEDSSMKVVGHVEQMRLSACYQKSTSLTCTTCHDPHAPLEESERVGHYRSVCQQCHTDQGCKLEPAVRRKKSPQDNCVFCHMPQVPTDIPHIAFTHHRIAIHRLDGAEEEPPRSKIGVLKPYLDLAGIDELERRRCLGLAYLEVSDSQSTIEAHLEYRTRARRLLEGVRKGGLRDGEVDAALARIYWRLDRPRAEKLGQSALQFPDLSSGGKMNALTVLGDLYLQTRQVDQAIDCFEQLTRIRQNSVDYLTLGECYARTGRLQTAQSTLRTALKMNPFNPQGHLLYAEVLRRLGEETAAQTHFQKAEQLKKHP